MIRAKVIVPLAVLLGLGFGALIWARSILSRQEERRDNLQKQLRQSESWHTALEVSNPATNEPNTQIDSNESHVSGNEEGDENRFRDKDTKLPKPHRVDGRESTERIP